MTETFGSKFKSKINQKYLHQTHFAADISVKDASVTQWIKGKAYPNKENLIKICDALDWDLKQAKKMIELEKKRCALAANGTEALTMEGVLMDFCSLPLFEQGLLLREMTETYYLRKLREEKQGQHSDLIPNDTSSQKSFSDREQPVE